MKGKANDFEVCHEVKCDTRDHFITVVQVTSSTSAMPLSDLKRIEAGHHVLYVLKLRTPQIIYRSREAKKDPTLVKYDTWQPRVPLAHTSLSEADTFKDHERIAFFKNKEDASRVLHLLDKEVITFDWGYGSAAHDIDLADKLEITKEICLFDGESLRPNGKDVAYAMEDVDECFRRFESPTDDQVPSHYLTSNEDSLYLFSLM